MRREEMNKEQKEVMLNAISKAYPFKLDKDLEEMETEKVLRALAVFRNNRSSAIAMYAKEEELGELFLLTSKEILAMYDSLPEGKKNQLRWADNHELIVSKVAAGFPELFELVEKDIQEQSLVNRAKSGIQNASLKIERSVTAIISTEEEANELKSQISKLFEKLRIETLEFDMNDCRKNEILELIATAHENGFKRVVEKLAEVPTKILFYRSGNSVAVKVKLPKAGYTFIKGEGKKIRDNRGKDKENYPLIVSACHIDEFLTINQVREADVLVDAKSLKQFYIFDQKPSVNLTPGFISEWYNHDCPELYRVTPNPHNQRGETMLGTLPIQFENLLVESSWSSVYVDEDITAEEVARLSSGYEHTRITKELRSVLKAKEIKGTSKIEELTSEVVAYDQRVQEVLNQNQSRILSALVTAFPERVVQNSENPADFKINDNFGLDCGFVYVNTTDEGYTEKRNLLANASSSMSKHMNVRLPLASQSLTLNRVQFDEAARIVQESLGIQLYANMVIN